MDEARIEPATGDMPGATAAFPFDRVTVERFRAAFPQARWRDELRAWFVPGTTAGQRLSTWFGRELPGALAFADERGRDAFAFAPVGSRYLEAADELLVRTPYARAIVAELQAVPWARWDGEAKLWRVPFRSWEALQGRWPAIEAAARHNEPEARRQRRQARKNPDAAALQAERRRRRYPIPADAPPPLDRPVMTHAGIVSFTGSDGELADPDIAARFYPDVAGGGAALVWAAWRKPSLAELVKTWPARMPPDAPDLARGWWQPTLEALRPERRRAKSREHAAATGRPASATPDPVAQG